MALLSRVIPVRTIHAVGRFDETPEELCIELTEQGYVSLGTAAHVAEAEAEQFILANAPCTPEEAVTLDELIKDSEQSWSTNNRVMKELCSKGVMQTTGLGQKKEIHSSISECGNLGRKADP